MYYYYFDVLFTINIIILFSTFIFRVPWDNQFNYFQILLSINDGPREIKSINFSISCDFLKTLFLFCMGKFGTQAQFQNGGVKF